LEPGAQLDLLLVSHVLGELDEHGFAELTAIAARARHVIWVEPGDHENSRRLIEVRDALAPGRRVLGPCTHSLACGLNRPGRERDWCHSFARPAPEVFTRADWREFSHRLKIDLRSVPYAYFALGEEGAEPAREGRIRILGRPRLEKGRALIDACDAGGVRTLRVLERDAKALVKEFAEPANLARTFLVTVEGDRAVSIQAE
jgi:ribosomal protein RSM22 (predicted rRNA methylase)